MNDTLIRIVVCIVAGFTYLAGAVPETMTFAGLATLPVAKWLMFIVNLLTGFASPSVIKKVVGVKSPPPSQGMSGGAPS